MPLKLQVNALYFNFIRIVILFMFYNSSPTGTNELGERKVALNGINLLPIIYLA